MLHGLCSTLHSIVLLQEWSSIRIDSDLIDNHNLRSMACTGQDIDVKC